MGDLEAVRDQAIFELLYSSGLRLAEVLRLTLQDVLGNPEELKILGKGSKERVVPVGKKAKGGTIHLARKPQGMGCRVSGFCFSSLRKVLASHQEQSNVDLIIAPEKSVSINAFIPTF